MFDFNDPRFEEFLAEWAGVLLTIPQATVVYYVGTSAWVPSTGSKLELEVVPNFIVRTNDEYWNQFSGLPHGRAHHDIIFQANPEQLNELSARWAEIGWIPTLVDRFRLIAEEPTSFVRVIEVPAGHNWSGPEYLRRIPNGVSVPRISQESLRRYNPTINRFEEPAHYWAIDESFCVGFQEKFNEELSL